MNQVTDLQDLKGKTITNVVYLIDYIGLSFEDKTYAVLVAHMGYDEHPEVSLSDESSPYAQEQLGLITHEEYKKIKEQEQERWCEAKKAQDLRMFQELKAKYGE